MSDLPLNTIIHGDCLDVMRGWPDGCVDAIVTDPPYFLPAAHYALRSGNYRSLADLSLLEHFYRDAFREIIRVLRPSGFAYVFCDGQSYPVFYIHAYAGFKNLRPLIWDKGTSINGYAWRHQHELVLFCTGHMSPAVPTGDGDILRARAVPIQSRQHPAEKPVSLIVPLVTKTTPPGGIVLDPFCGSGTTCVAAKREGFNYIGIDISPDYCEIARRRVAATEQNLFASNGG